MFRIRRVDHYADSSVVGSKLLPGFFLSKEEGKAAARIKAFEIKPYHPGYPSNVYRTENGFFVVSKYGRSVSFIVADKGVYY